MTDRAALLDVLLADPAKGAHLPRGEAAALLIALAPVQTALHLAATAPPPAPVTEPAREPARMLTLAEVAEQSGKSIRWWREHWRLEIPRATRKGRTVLVPEEEFLKWRQR